MAKYIIDCDEATKYSYVTIAKNFTNTILIPISLLNDAQEVVTCEKCCYGELNGDGITIYCNKLRSGVDMQLDDFCSYGEKKTNE